MDLREAYIKGYIDACEMNAQFGFDENCNSEMVLTLEDFLKEDASQPTGQAKCCEEMVWTHHRGLVCKNCGKAKDLPAGD